MPKSSANHRDSLLVSALILLFSKKFLDILVARDAICITRSLGCVATLRYAPKRGTVP